MSELEIRRAAFAWLAETVVSHGDVLDGRLLGQGFAYNGQRVPMMSMQGIFKPAVCDLPLSIRTGKESPYNDHFEGEHLLYSYRGTDPNHRDNRGLHELMRQQIPLVYLHAVVKARYLAVWPVLIVGDDPRRLRFMVQAQADGLRLGAAMLSAPNAGEGRTDEVARREYATRSVQVRLHQRGFRERVLAAYGQQCSMCRLKHPELLDGAHIKPDSFGGEPEVSNGLALCKIHHAAFDVGVIGVRPNNLRVKVREDILRQIDGPMLKHGLQDMDGQALWTPRDPAKRPALANLEWKWERFERAG